MEDEFKPDLAFFYDLDYENKTCLDCRGALPSFISINNAIILCHSCAQMHKELGFNVSFIRAVNDEWDPYLLSFVQRGGNGRFIRFCIDYKLSELPIKVKYKTKAADYYRKVILSEVQADSPPEPILMNEALEESFNTIIFPEFDNYSIFKGEKLKSNGGNGMTGKLIQSLYTVGEGIGSASHYIGETVNNADFKDKIVNGSSATFEGIKTASGVVYSYSQPVVSFIASKTVQGMGYLFQSIANSVNDYQNQHFQVKENDKNDKSKATLKEPQYQLNSPTQCHCHNHCNKCCYNEQSTYCLQSQYSQPKKQSTAIESEPVLSPVQANEVYPPTISMISSSSNVVVESKAAIPKPILKIEKNQLVIDKEKEKEKQKKPPSSQSIPIYEVLVKDKKPNDINKQDSIVNINNSSNYN